PLLQLVAVQFLFLQEAEDGQLQQWRSDVSNRYIDASIASGWRQEQASPTSRSRPQDRGRVTAAGRYPVSRARGRRPRDAPVSFRPDEIGRSLAGRSLPGEIDYRLARNMVVNEFKR